MQCPELFVVLIAMAFAYPCPAVEVGNCFRAPDQDNTLSGGRLLMTADTIVPIKSAAWQRSQSEVTFADKKITLIEKLEAQLNALKNLKQYVQRAVQSGEIKSGEEAHFAKNLGLSFATDLSKYGFTANRIAIAKSGSGSVGWLLQREYKIDGVGVLSLGDRVCVVDVWQNMSFLGNTRTPPQDLMRATSVPPECKRMVDKSYSCGSSASQIDGALRVGEKVLFRADSDSKGAIVARGARHVVTGTVDRGGSMFLISSNGMTLQTRRLRGIQIDPSFSGPAFQ